MKKLKLKALELSAEELLTREQMKTVYGGSGSVWASRGCINSCQGECEIYQDGMGFEGHCYLNSGGDCYCHAS